MQVLNVTKFRPLLQVFLVKTFIAFDRTHYGLQKILALIAGYKSAIAEGKLLLSTRYQALPGAW